MVMFSKWFVGKGPNTVEPHRCSYGNVLFNINRGRGQSAKSANDFNPYAKGMASPEQNKPMTADDVKALADEMKQHGRKK